jgi:hypothetical protein
MGYDNIDPTKITDAGGVLLHHCWVEGEDKLGAYYRDVLRPDLNLTIRLNSQTKEWHAQFYCASTKGFVDLRFTTPQRAFEFGHATRWAIAAGALAV